MSRTELGYYSTFYFVGATVSGIYTGRIVDQIGVRAGIFLGIVVLGLSMFLYGFAPAYAVILILALLTGLGLSVVTPGVNKGVILEAPPGQRAVSIGIMQVGIGVGGFVGASAIPILAGMIGWRLAVQMAALLALIVGGIFVYIYRDGTSRADSVKVGALPVYSLKDNVTSLLRTPGFLWVCCLGLALGAGAGTVSSHFAVFLTEDLGMSAAVAGFGLAMFQVGGTVGRPVWGFKSDRLFLHDRRKTLFVVSTVIGSLYIIMGLFGPLLMVNSFTVVVAAFIVGYAGFGYFGVYSVTVAEIAGSENIGVATGLALFFGRTGVFTMPPIFGYIADLTGNYTISWSVTGVIILLVATAFYLWSPHFGDPLS